MGGIIAIIRSKFPLNALSRKSSFRNKDNNIYKDISMEEKIFSVMSKKIMGSMLCFHYTDESILSFQVQYSVLSRVVLFEHK